MSFAGKVILVTGASSGIGADAARHLAQLGAKVAIVGRNESRLNDTVDEIKRNGSAMPLSIVADVTKDAERIVNETIAHFGQLDVLINSAGYAIEDSVINADLSKFDQLFDTNVRAVINLTKLCVPHLEKTNGNIVNVSSIAGMKVFPGVMSYCMSKAALDQFTKCSALDLAPKRIRVNSIQPGAIVTNFHQTSYGMTKGEYNEYLERNTPKYLVGRVGKVSDTSAAIAYLADNNSSSFLTGVLHVVDGGFLLN